MIDEKTLYSIVDKAKAYDMLTFIHKKKMISCSFCGKSQDGVRKLVAGPNVYICDECVELCVEIIDEDKSKDEGKTGDDNNEEHD